MLTSKQLILSALQPVLHLAVVMTILLAFGSLQAKEVSQQHRGLTLNANLEIAEGKDFKDGMVLILHGILGHNKMELVATSQQILLENEMNSLAINLSLSRSNRHGFFDCTWPHYHQQDDVFEELNLWVDWLRKKGVSKIALMGHSRGSNQSMVYAAEHLDPTVTHLVLLSPGADDVRETHEKRYGSVLNATADLMQEMIKSNKGEELIDGVDFWFCPKATVTANSYLSYYGEMSKFREFQTYIPQIPVPTLIITGTMDERFPNVRKNIRPFIDNKRIYSSEIENAGHFFRDLNLEEAVETMIDFLKKTQ